jgi:hypothetical protein
VCLHLNRYTNEVADITFQFVQLQNCEMSTDVSVSTVISIMFGLVCAVALHWKHATHLSYLNFLRKCFYIIISDGTEP